MMPRRNKRVLVLLDYYEPGYRASCPWHSVVNLIRQLSGQIDFAVVTRNNDFRDPTPYAGIVPGRWQRRDGMAVSYLAGGFLLGLRLLRVLVTCRYDALYINSVFSPCFSILPLCARRAGLLGSRAIIVAPRGELARGALQIKTAKKRIFLKLARWARLYDGVRWHVSTREEESEVDSVFAGDQEIDAVVAPDLGPASSPRPTGGVPKRVGELIVCFLARITRKKNLDGALRMLSALAVPMTFRIYGPTEDPVYWETCRELMRTLPANVTAEFWGAVDPSQVQEIFLNAHALLLPSWGESFAHCILEALLAGRPVVISDRTPWRGLEARHAGWDIPLDDERKFREVLTQLAGMDASEYALWSEGARKLGEEYLRQPEVLAASNRIFA